DGVVAALARASQLPATHGRPGRGGRWAVAADSRRARSAERTRPGDLPVRGGPLLCQCEPLRRRGQGARRTRAGPGAVPGGRCRRDHERGLLGRTDGAGPPAGPRPRRRCADAGPCRGEPAGRPRPSSPDRRHRSAMHLHQPARSSLDHTPASASSRLDASSPRWEGPVATAHGTPRTDAPRPCPPPPDRLGPAPVDVTLERVRAGLRAARYITTGRVETALFLAL